VRAAFFALGDRDSGDGCGEADLAGRAPRPRSCGAGVVHSAAAGRDKQFAPAEYLLDISDHTTKAVSVIPTPANRSATYGPTRSVRSCAEHKRLANRAFSCANFIDFRRPGPPPALP
jgi:hypothetical protein